MAVTSRTRTSPTRSSISPFLADTLGNAFNFYNTFDVTDDVLHFLNWVLLVAGITLLLLRTHIPPLAAWALAYGIGGLAIIWWEAAEWLVQELGTAGLDLTYGDTIGDLVISSTGGAIGAGLAVWGSQRRSRCRRPGAGGGRCRGITGRRDASMRA